MRGAWLSEFALKFFKDNDKNRFRKILSYSSVPLIKIDKLRLSIDSSEGVCTLSYPVVLG